MTTCNRRPGTRRIKKAVAALLMASAVATALLGGAPLAAAGSGELTLIHMGDLHGHLVPRPGFRDGQSGQMLGGLARMYTKIQEIRAREKNTLLVNGGDTVQGSAEVLFTRGQAIVDVLNRFNIDAFNPGNWDYVYGSRRFVETLRRQGAESELECDRGEPVLRDRRCRAADVLSGLRRPARPAALSHQAVR